MATNKASRKRAKAPKQPTPLLRPIGIVHSPITDRHNAPKQGNDGAPDVWLEIRSFALKAVRDLRVGDEIIVLTWFHRARRNVYEVHPRSDPRRRLTGVFATRSPDRPNPIGLHRVTVRAIHNNRLLIGPMEAIDGTPVIDIKPELACVRDS